MVREDSLNTNSRGLLDSRVQRWQARKQPELWPGDERMVSCACEPLSADD